MRDRFASQALFGGILGLGLAAPAATAASASSPLTAAAGLAELAQTAAPDGRPAASTFVCRIECPELTPERAGEVEARARAALITNAAEVNEATFECDVEAVTVSVSAGQASARVSAPKTGASLNDLLLDTFEQALSRLSAPGLSGAVAAPEGEPEATAGSLEASPPLPQALPAPPPLQSGAKVRPPSAERTQSSRTGGAAPYQAELAGGVALESWTGNAVLGPLAGVSYGRQALALELRLGALFPLHAAAAFRASELSAALGVRWQPSWSAGVRLVVAVGASSLSASQRGPYEPLGATRVGAGFAELALSRPFGLGPWALAPEAGLRLFTAKRSVTLDQDAQLRLLRAAPHLAIIISRRFE